jgi:hypothetical protein
VPRRETLGSTRVLGAGALVDRVLRFSTAIHQNYLSSESSE